MNETVWLLIISFGLMLFMNVPIAVAIAASTFLRVFATGGDATYTVALRMANGIDSFTLLAIPFSFYQDYSWGRAVSRGA